MGLEDITTDARHPILKAQTPLPGQAPPNDAKLHKAYNLDEIGVIRKGVAPQPAREEPTIHRFGSVDQIR